MSTKKEAEEARKRAIAAFETLADGASTIPKTKLSAALKGAGFSDDHRMQCQALMVLDRNGDISKDDFVKWCDSMVAEGAHRVDRERRAIILGDSVRQRGSAHEDMGKKLCETER